MIDWDVRRTLVTARGPRPRGRRRRAGPRRRHAPRARGPAAAAAGPVRPWPARALRDAGLELTAHETVATPYEVPDQATPDQATLELVFMVDARGYGAVERIGEAASRAAIVEAAAPFRRPDGSYRFQNAFRY